MFGATITLIMLAAALDHHPVKALPTVDGTTIKRCNTDGEAHSYASASCPPLTIGKCEFGRPFYTTYLVTFNECWDLCISSAPWCTYFVYDYKSKSCNLHAGEQLGSAVSRCDQKGGFRGDTRCGDDKNCWNFLLFLTNCTQFGNPTRRHYGIYGFYSCGELCKKFATDCKYFVFDASKKTCETFDTAQKTHCTAVVGPPYPTSSSPSLSLVGLA